jgi:hypothetical protein
MGPPSSRASAYAVLAHSVERLIAWQDDPLPWMEQNLWLRTKERAVAPFLLNRPQRDYYHQRTSRNLILKARQLGFTTLTCGLFFADTLLNPNTDSAVVGHDADSSQRIFQIVHLFQQRLPETEKQEIGRPHILNRREIYWPKLNSRFYVGTAGSLTFGRGQTINNLLCSEFAYWPKPEEALIALTEALTPKGRVVVESTANGTGGHFHETWVAARAGENGFRPHFYAWWWAPEYRLLGPPLGELTKEEQQLKQLHDLDDDQLRWRRAKTRELRDRFAQEYPEDDVTCFLASNRGCFDLRALAEAGMRIAGEPQPEHVLSLRDRSGQSLAISPARLFIWRRAEAGHSYVVGSDTGEGLAHSDPSAACVLDETSGEQVAELQGRVSPERFARLLDALGRYYHEAHLGVERNGHGHSVLNTLMHTTHYPALYHHTDYDQSGLQERRPGWPTSQKTKPIMIDDLAAAIAGGHLLIHSAELVDECRSFVTMDNGSTGAQPGRHDDRVVAAAIAWQVRKRPKPVFRIGRA